MMYFDPLGFAKEGDREGGPLGGRAPVESLEPRAVGLGVGRGQGTHTASLGFNWVAPTGHPVPELFSLVFSGSFRI